ncbi:MAG: TrmH family RNA methyltransferase [Bacteroidaceae bacterium]
MAQTKITSLQNPKIKQLLCLQQKSSERRRQNLFVVEGRRELTRCLKAGHKADTIFFCPEIDNFNPSSLGTTKNIYEVSYEIYNKIAYRGTTEGVIAMVTPRNISLSDLCLKENPLLVVLERVEKPGNLGAVLRSADASGVDAVIVCDPLTDLYNPNLIRNSTGAIFSVPCFTTTSQKCIEWLKSNHIQIVTAQLQDSVEYYNTDLARSTAIVMGTEADGLSLLWREIADCHIRIPMLGMVDSLNVSVSAAILMYEALRQRRNK